MPKNILVIDDEELITNSLLKLLSEEGYKVKVVSNGRDAIEMVKENDFDLIISDVRMPELDGIETIGAIRSYLKKTNKKPIPEIVITGYADNERYEAAIELKVADYLYKPFGVEYFLKTVKRALSR